MLRRAAAIVAIAALALVVALGALALIAYVALRMMLDVALEADRPLE